MSEKKQPRLDTWFHNALIYFFFWAFAAIAVYSGIMQISDSIENGMPNTALFVILGALLAVDGLALIKVRFDLAKLRTGTPKAIAIVGGAASAILLLTQLLIYMSAEDVYARDVGTGVIVALWTFVLYRYYHEREYLFVN